MWGIILIGILVGAHQLGFRASLWLRLPLVISIIVAESLMILRAVQGFETLLAYNWYYIIGVPIGLLFRSWKTGEKFLSFRHADWVVLTIATVIMQSLYVRP